MYVCICVGVGYEYTCDMHVLDAVSQKLYILFFETSSLWDLVLIVWDRLVGFGHLPHKWEKTGSASKDQHSAFDSRIRKIIPSLAE